MNKKHLFAAIVALMGMTIFHSCKKSEQLNSSQTNDSKAPKGYVSQFKGAPRFPNEPIKVNVFDMSAIADILDQKKQNTVDVLRDSAWASGNGKTLFVQSTEMPAIFDNIRRQVYLGAIVKGEDAGNPNNFKPVFVTVAERNPITIYATFPTDSISRKVAAPSPTTDLAYIRAALKVGSGKQLSSFRYEMESFKRYEELKLSFGANISVAGLFSLNIKDSTALAGAKTRVRAEFTQENFAINVEPPIYEPFLKDPVNKGKFGNYDPLIVSSITYGRKGIMTLESDSSYKSVTSAIRATFSLSLPVLKEIVNNPILAINAGMSKQQLETLNNSKIVVYVIGTEGKDSIKIVQGISGFAQIIAGGGEFSADSPGTPLYYTLNYLSDYSTFWNRFQVQVHNN
ncbi:thiol-activated cytolysin family protein [Pedobacter sp. PAMC26386]|nr:thiol-activated cytolysin family protein [Pedobacter sp. PAMC26386]